MATFIDPDDERGFIQPLRMWDTPVADNTRPPVEADDPFEHTEADAVVWEALMMAARRDAKRGLI